MMILVFSLSETIISGLKSLFCSLKQNITFFANWDIFNGSEIIHNKSF